MKQSKIVSASGALIVLVCFFLPWVTVSCSGQPIAELSGYELAAGTEINTGFQVERTEGESILFLIPLIALAAAGSILIASRSGSATREITQGLAAGGGMLLLLLKWLQMSSDAAESGLEVVARYGMWGTGVGLILLILGAVVARNEAEKQAEGRPERNQPGAKAVAVVNEAEKQPEARVSENVYRPGSRSCPACATPLAPDSRFCPGCGQAVA